MTEKEYDEYIDVQAEMQDEWEKELENDYFLMNEVN